MRASGVETNRGESREEPEGLNRGGRSLASSPAYIVALQPIRSVLTTMLSK